MGDPVDAATEPKTITIVLADDHAMVRAGLRQVLDAEPDLTVVAEAGEVHGALACAAAHRPTVVVLDINMPGGPTVAAIPQFLEAAPDSSVVMLTMQDDLGFVREALSLGASG